VEEPYASSMKFKVAKDAKVLVWVP
jgi:hypothetical protein